MGSIIIYSGVPWDVLVILLGLGIFSSLFARSRLFSALAVWCSRASQGKYLLILIMFSSIMFFLSCTLNNLTALLLVLPVLLSILKALGTTQGFIALCFSMVIVACNLGGAATPIGDFPAILLMGTGSISFVRYLILAFPMCILLFGVILVLFSVYYNRRGSEDAAPLERSLALISMAKLYRNFTIDKTILYPGIGVFCFMFGLWIIAGKIGLSPGVICFLGVGLLMVIKNEEAEDIVRHGIDFESILFLTALFLMVSCMAGSGILDAIAGFMTVYFTDTKMLVCALMVCCGISTAIFSAGPSMATMLPIAQQVIAKGGGPGGDGLCGAGPVRVCWIEFPSHRCYCRAPGAIDCRKIGVDNEGGRKRKIRFHDFSAIRDFCVCHYPGGGIGFCSTKDLKGDKKIALD